jgi:hypothetical protein
VLTVALLLGALLNVVVLRLLISCCNSSLSFANEASVSRVLVTAVD